MRRVAATTLAVLLALPVGEVRSAQTTGTISGNVRLDGRPVSGATVAFIELQSGAVVRAVSKDDGTFEVPAPPGEYAVTTESQAGLTVGEAPVRVAVAEGKVGAADITLVAVPSAVAPAPAAAEPGAASQPPAAVDIAAPAAAAAAASAPQTPPAEGQAPGAFAETTGTGAQIKFEPVTCFVAGEFPLLDAGVEPIASVARARVYFRGAKGAAYYYVEMTSENGRYFGKLPRPRVEASPITYYLQSTTTSFEESQTREIEAAVVAEKSECGDRRVAAFGPPGPITVFSAQTGASILTPAGFAAAAASGIVAGLIAIIAGGAAAAGIVGGVVTGNPGGPTPPPVVVQPSAIPPPIPVTPPTLAPITLDR